MLLEPPDGVGQALHIVVVDIGDFLEPCYVAVRRNRHKLAARVAENVDGVVVMVVADQGLRLVSGVPDDVLRHVDAGCIGVLRLNCVLAVSPDPSD